MRAASEPGPAQARHLTWDGYRNCRDLGGLPTPHGPTLLGRVARGPRRESLTARGWSDARRWGLRTVVDLRCPDETGTRAGDPRIDPDATEGIEVVPAPTEDHDNAEFRRVCFPILDSPAYWPHNLRILPELIARTLRAIAGARPGVLVHCSAGRDRTGLITALLLANAGVPPGVIADDYAESVRAMAGHATHAPTVDRQSTWGEERVASWLAATRPPVIEFAHAVDRHLDRVGIAAKEREDLRALLVTA